MAIILELSLLLAAMAIAAFPCWRYSADWGYGPSLTMGVALVAIAVMAVIGGGPASHRPASNDVAIAGEPSPSDAPPGRRRGSSPPH